MTSAQYRVLAALRDGRSCELWPLMRRLFLRRKWIKTAGDPPPPADAPHAKKPVRPYLVTRRGRSALIAHEQELRSEGTVPCGPMRIGFGKEDPCAH